MPIYQRDPYRSDLTGTIAELMMRQGQARASGARQVADIQARGTLQQGQNRAQLYGTLGDIAANGITSYMQNRQREQEQAPKREMERQQVELGRRELAAGETSMKANSAAREAVRLIKGGNAEAVLSQLDPAVRVIAEGYLTETAKHQQARKALTDTQRQRTAQAIQRFGYDPDAAAIVAGLNDDDPELTQAFEATKSDPAKFRQLVDFYANPGPAKPPTYSQEDPTKTTVMTDPVTGQRTVVAAGVPEVKPDTRSIGALLADAAKRGDRAEYNRLLQTVKDQATAGRDPNANATTNEPLVAVMGDNGEPVLMRRSQAAGRRPANNREQGRAVTAGSASTLAELQTSLDDTRTLRQQLGKTGAGSKIGAVLPNAVTEFTGWGADSKSRQAVIDRVKQVIGKALEGGVLRKEDELKYEKILPTIGDPPQVAKSKLDGLEKALALRRERLLESLDDAGYDIGQFTARTGAPAAKPAASMSPASGTVQMRAPDGSLKAVPSDQVEHYRALGAVVVR